jgi:hypothetical protein
MVEGMMIKNMGSKILIFVLSAPLIAHAAIDTSNLIKADSQMKQPCVEYYRYQGAMYCSTKPLSKNPVDPNLKNYETQTIVFDDRPWQPVWGQKKDSIVTVEYIPMGDDINNWNELVTSQFFPGLQNKLSPEQFAALSIKGMKESGFDPVIKVIQNSKDTYIFEFQIKSPPAQQQDEIQKISVGLDGLYVLHYVIKKTDMDNKNRDVWISNLSKSGMKNIP